MDSPESSPVLFRTPDLLVKRGPVVGSSVCFVTFMGFKTERTLDLQGWGAAFLESRGFDAIHVISRTNAWYAYAEMDAAMASVRRATAAYDRAITYGSSMGAYASVRFAASAGASAAIALSPQYGASGPAVPFETRFRPEGVRLRGVRWPWHGSTEVTPYVFFDPHDRDALHERLIRRSYPLACPVPLPNASHGAGAFLQEIGLLESAVVDIANGAFEPIAFAQEAWRRRRASAQYLYTLARRLGPGHLRTKIALMERAIRFTDEGPRRAYLAMLHEMNGDPAAAETQLALAERSPGNHFVQYAKAGLLMRQDRQQQAKSAAEKLLHLSAPSDDLFSDLAVLIGSLPEDPRGTTPPSEAKARATRVARTFRFLPIQLVAKACTSPLWRRLKLPPWHARYFDLTRQFQVIDEGRWRRQAARAARRAGASRGQAAPATKRATAPRYAPRLGRLEGVRGEDLIGWALDLERPSEPVRLVARSDRGHVETVTLDQPRGDVIERFGPGAMGFRLPIARFPEAAQLSLQWEDTGVHLAGSPWVAPRGP